MYPNGGGESSTVIGSSSSSSSTDSSPGAEGWGLLAKRGHRKGASALTDGFDAGGRTGAEGCGRRGGSDDDGVRRAVHKGLGDCDAGNIV